MFAASVATAAAGWNKRTKRDSLYLSFVSEFFLFLFRSRQICVASEQRVRRSFPFGYWIRLLCRYFDCMGVCRVPCVANSQLSSTSVSEANTVYTCDPCLYSTISMSILRYTSGTEYILRAITWFRFEGFLYTHTGGTRIKENEEKDEGEGDGDKNRWAISFCSLFSTDDQHFYFLRTWDDVVVHIRPQRSAFFPFNSCVSRLPCAKYFNTKT